MNAEIVFTFPNTHSAVAGEKALAASGVEVRVMSRPSALGEGCGICLRVDEEDREQARAALGEAGVAVEAVFMKIRRDGKNEYLPCPS